MRLAPCPTKGKPCIRIQVTHPPHWAFTHSFCCPISCHILQAWLSPANPSGLKLTPLLTLAFATCSSGHSQLPAFASRLWLRSSPHSRISGCSFYPQVRSDFTWGAFSALSTKPTWHEACPSCLIFHPLWTLTSVAQGAQHPLHYVNL